MTGFLKIFIAAVVLVGLCVIGLCFNIIFRKNGEFPQTEISRNKEMRKRGIRCVNEEERIRMGKKDSAPSCTENDCAGCSGCDFLKNNPREAAQ